MWRRLSLCLARFQRPVEWIWRILLFIAMMGIWNLSMPRPLPRFSKKTRFLKTGAPVSSNWSAWKQPHFFWVPPSRPVPASNSSIFRRGGVMPTAICLSKAAIGAGVLSVSAHSAEVGAFYQLTCLLHLGIDGWTLQTVAGNFTKSHLGIHEIYACCVML